MFQNSLQFPVSLSWIPPVSLFFQVKVPPPSQFESDDEEAGDEEDVIEIRADDEVNYNQTDEGDNAREEDGPTGSSSHQQDQQDNQHAIDAIQIQREIVRENDISLISQDQKDIATHDVAEYENIYIQERVNVVKNVVTIIEID